MRTHKIELDSREVFISQRGDLFKVIKPFKNEDGSLNWFNILTGGSWINLMVTVVIVIMILGLLNEYSTNINLLKDCFRVPGMLNQCIETFGDKNYLRLLP